MTLNFLVPPSWPKMALNPKKRHKIDLKSNLNHEGGTQKFRAQVQNKAIYISFQNKLNLVLLLGEQPLNKTKKNWQNEETLFSF